jgi:hypothetical protein
VRGRAERHAARRAALRRLTVLCTARRFSPEDGQCARGGGTGALPAATGALAAAAARERWGWGGRRREEEMLQAFPRRLLAAAVAEVSAVLPGAHVYASLLQPRPPGAWPPAGPPAEAVHALTEHKAHPAQSLSMSMTAPAGKAGDGGGSNSRSAAGRPLAAAGASAASMSLTATRGRDLSRSRSRSHSRSRSRSRKGHGHSRHGRMKTATGMTAGRSAAMQKKGLALADVREAAPDQRQRPGLRARRRIRRTAAKARREARARRMAAGTLALRFAAAGGGSQMEGVVLPEAVGVAWACVRRGLPLLVRDGAHPLMQAGRLTQKRDSGDDEGDDDVFGAEEHALRALRRRQRRMSAISTWELPATSAGVGVGGGGGGGPAASRGYGSGGGGGSGSCGSSSGSGNESGSGSGSEGSEGHGNDSDSASVSGSDVAPAQAREMRVRAAYPPLPTAVLRFPLVVVPLIASAPPVAPLVPPLVDDRAEAKREAEREKRKKGKNRQSLGALPPGIDTAAAVRAGAGGGDSAPLVLGTLHVDGLGQCPQGRRDDAQPDHEAGVVAFLAEVGAVVGRALRAHAAAAALQRMRSHARSVAAACAPDVRELYGAALHAALDRVQYGTKAEVWRMVGEGRAGERRVQRLACLRVCAADAAGNAVGAAGGGAVGTGGVTVQGGWDARAGRELDLRHREVSLSLVPLGATVNGLLRKPPMPVGHGRRGPRGGRRRADQAADEAAAGGAAAAAAADDDDVSAGAGSAFLLVERHREIVAPFFDGGDRAVGRRDADKAAAARGGGQAGSYLRETARHDAAGGSDRFAIAVTRARGRECPAEDLAAVEEVSLCLAQLLLPFRDEQVCIVTCWQFVRKGTAACMRVRTDGRPCHCFATQEDAADDAAAAALAAALAAAAATNAASLAESMVRLRATACCFTPCTPALGATTLCCPQQTRPADLANTPTGCGRWGGRGDEATAPAQRAAAVAE